MRGARRIVHDVSPKSVRPLSFGHVCPQPQYERAATGAKMPASRSNLGLYVRSLGWAANGPKTGLGRQALGLEKWSWCTECVHCVSASHFGSGSHQRGCTLAASKVLELSEPPHPPSPIPSPGEGGRERGRKGRGGLKSLVPSHKAIKSNTKATKTYKKI